jgi:DNA-cytosine methyltransferase
MPTFGSLFTGFGGADIGAAAAGFTSLWGVEYMADIAGVANSNLGNHVRVADVLACDPRDFAPVDLLHASPPCPNFSVAKTGREETAHDIAMADKVAEFIRVLRPRFVTIENVPQYAKAQSYKRILDSLAEMGYFYDAQVLNAADYGVPQTRKRLIVRAVHGGFVPHLPAPMPWIGWYAAIADMIGTLPASQFAEWQLKRLPESLRESVIVEGSAAGEDNKFTMPVREGDEPVFTMRAEQNNPRAFIVGGANTSDEQAAPGVGVSEAGEPSRCVATNGTQWRALLIDGQQTNPAPDGARVLNTRTDAEPAITINASQTKGMHIALLIESRNSNQEWSVGMRAHDAPALTVVTDDRPSHAPKGWLMNRNISERDDLAREDEQPAYAVTTNDDGRRRAWLSTGRVVQMTPRALARFQSFPDWYQLPDKRSLACRGIGNAVPPLMYQAVAGAFIQGE